MDSGLRDYIEGYIGGIVSMGKLFCCYIYFIKE